MLCFAGNAFKYTMAGTITVKMRISPLWATLSVTDTGVGIPTQDLDRGECTCVPLLTSASLIIRQSSSDSIGLR